MNLLSGAPRRDRRRRRVPDRLPADSTARAPAVARSSSSRPRSVRSCSRSRALFWAYSVVAEVFALNNLLRRAAPLRRAASGAGGPSASRLALAASRSCSGSRSATSRRSCCSCRRFVVLGLAGLAERSRVRHRPRDPARSGALVAGLLPYLYLPIAASANPAMNWGDPTILGQVRERRHPRRLRHDDPRGRREERLGRREPRAALGGPRPRVRLRRDPARDRRALVGLAAPASRGHRARSSRFLVAGPLFQAYTRTAYPDPLTKGIVARFYILPSIPARDPRRPSAPGGCSAWLDGRKRLVPAVVAAAALLALPAAAAANHYSAADQSGEPRRRELRAATCSAGSRRTRCSLMRGDENYTSVSYAQNVEHLRPDVIALDAELLKLPSYVDADEARASRSRDPVHSLRRRSTGRRSTRSSRRTSPSRPVYSTGVQEEKRFGAPFAQLHAGLATGSSRRGRPRDLYALMRRDAAAFERLHFPTRAYPETSWEHRIGEVLRLGRARPRLRARQRSRSRRPARPAALPHGDPALAGSDDRVPEPRASRSTGTAATRPRSSRSGPST